MQFDQKQVDLFFQNLGEAYRSAKHLSSSYQRMKKIIPITADGLNNLNNEALDMVDAFRVRYCDLQDSLGNKVFRALLKLEEEDSGSNIDMINKMEKRKIIDSFDSFKRVRNIRNAFSHDYPDDDELKAQLVNDAHKTTKDLIHILNNVINYIVMTCKLGIKDFKPISI